MRLLLFYVDGPSAEVVLDPWKGKVACCRLSRTRE